MTICDHWKQSSRVVRFVRERSYASQQDGVHFSVMMTTSTAKMSKCKSHSTELPIRSDKIKSGNMEIGTRGQAGMEVTVNRASKEQWQNQGRKYENLVENACENRSDAI